MSPLELTKSGLRQGIWHGVLSGGGDEAPDLDVTHLGDPVPDVTLTPTATAGNWVLRIPIPVNIITDGVQTILISDAKNGARLQSIAILAGEALGDDMRAEIDLLRAELDMLKRAFRRHCVETT